VSCAGESSITNIFSTKSDWLMADWIDFASDIRPIVGITTVTVEPIVELYN
jgi:hypothetical protein